MMRSTGEPLRFLSGKYAHVGEIETPGIGIETLVIKARGASGQRDVRDLLERRVGRVESCRDC